MKLKQSSIIENILKEKVKKFYDPEAMKTKEYIEKERIIEIIKDFLTEYDKFLLENGYTDSDVWYPPTAIDRFLNHELNK